ncbi:hypothetical protein ACEZCY_35770 [Streptacidiphilus sp. N1-12]|uniref:Uncharacterized protein n=1 Tax=Streptacidiphilus alkalitolerans TaxID=3342712 RepID=A0ABV6WSG1_9ACTN
MALRYIGVDPDTKNGGSPTVWLDPDATEIVIQGWMLNEPLGADAHQAHTAASPVPSAVRVPVRLATVLRQACEAADRLPVGTVHAAELVWPGALLDAAAGEIIVRGWSPDDGLLAQIHQTPAPDHAPGIPAGEAAVRLPVHQVAALREACDAADRLG